MVSYTTFDKLLLREYIAKLMHSFWLSLDIVHTHFLIYSQGNILIHGVKQDLLPSLCTFISLCYRE